ncbi:MAG: hypothetical protein AB1696_28025 [Planctomycetota bacterium]
MNMDAVPIWAIFAGTTILVVIAIELGYGLGRAVHRRSEDEKESPVSAIAAAILGLLAFMLAFTFGIVAERFDARKGLVRDEANAVRTAYLRSDFLPESDRGEVANLLARYLDDRLAFTESRDLDQVKKGLIEADRIHRQLWEMAVVNARKDMNSDVAALYIESLNEVIAFHALRVAVGLQARIPAGIWLVLYALVVLGMAGVGYQTGIAGSRRSWARLILALSFSMVIALIAALDNPLRGHVAVSQQPLADLRAAMAADAEARSGRGEKP